MTNIDVLWTSSRVEGMADGSLPPAEARRMRAAMRRDPALRAAVERAIALRRDLRRLDAAAVPRGLRRSLLAIAAERNAPPARYARPAWAAGAIAAIVAGTAALLVVQNARESAAVAREQAAALEQVELAMTYLQRSSEKAGAHVRDAMRTSLLAAVETSRKAMKEVPPQPADGDGA
jgi:hypothetical protein